MRFLIAKNDDSAQIRFRVQLYIPADTKQSGRTGTARSGRGDPGPGRIPNVPAPSQRRTCRCRSPQAGKKKADLPPGRLRARILIGWRRLQGQSRRGRRRPGPTWRSLIQAVSRPDLGKRGSRRTHTAGSRPLHRSGRSRNRVLDPMRCRRARRREPSTCNKNVPASLIHRSPPEHCGGRIRPAAGPRPLSPRK